MTANVRSAPWCSVATPDGPFTLITDPEGGTVVASGWTDQPEYLLPLVHRTLRPDGLHRSAALPTLTDAVDAYYSGEFIAVRHVPVTQRGGPFIERVWAALREVEPGHPISYSVLAERAGGAAAIRAAGAACARNAAALFVPCHRARRADGSLGGFRYGLDLKATLLDRESG